MSDFLYPGRTPVLSFYGPTHKEILKAYTGLTGRPALPPAWSFGLWLSTSFTTDYDEQTVTSFLEGMEERKIPLSVFHFDCFWMKGLQWCDFEWDPETFPDVKGMLQRYHERGLKICVWINPYIAQGTKTFREAAAGGYLLKRADGHGIWQTDNWQNGMGVVDFTNPKACKWYQGKLRSLLEMGVDCFKTDFGERIPIDVVYQDGSEPVSMHNYYAFLYNRCVFELLKEVKGQQEAVVFARSATAGGQQFPVHWEVTAAHLTFPWQRRCVEVCRLRCLDFPSGVMISVALKILLLQMYTNDGLHLACFPLTAACMDREATGYRGHLMSRPVMWRDILCS